jgi:hypothetical protein
MDKRMKIMYNECTPIKGRLSTAWIVKFSRGKHLLLVYHKSAKIEDVVDFVRLNYMGKFTVGEIDCGTFNLDSQHPIDHSYSSDSRQVNQNVEVIIEGI